MTKMEINQGEHLQRGVISVEVGAYVKYLNRSHRIREYIDLRSVLLLDLETGRHCTALVTELESTLDHSSSSWTDLETIADEDWKEAERRLEAIKPLMEMNRYGRKDVSARATALGVDTGTLYRWLQRFKSTGSTVSLVSQKAGWREGRGRLDSLSEAVVQEVIEKFYLTPQRPTKQKAILEVLRLCNERVVKPPSQRTIRYRLDKIPERTMLRGRGQKERALNRFTPAAGSFPGADYPLAVVQIDHTPVDIIIVDDEHRKPIGRPWITLAIDVYSRMIVGMYLSIDAPSETSVAMCVASAILPKEEWLLSLGVLAEWPVWGVPQKIHVDNGSDFRSEGFRKSCKGYAIDLEFRPVKRPRYGGHIERLIGTFMKEVHALPGTTFSSVKDREDYDSEKNAAMTRGELEIWLIKLVCKIYHARRHASLGISPIKQWEIGVFGSAGSPGVGMPARPASRQLVLLDFLPSFSRTVQAFGVTIDGRTYYAESLRPWINALDPNDTKRKRELVFRRDPRDISIIWFRDPEIGEYFQVPFANQSLPSMSVWEHRQAKDRLKAQGIDPEADQQVLRALTEMRDDVEQSKDKTKRARRQAQRSKDHREIVKIVHSKSQEIALADQNPAKSSSLGRYSGSLLDDVVEVDFGRLA